MRGAAFAVGVAAALVVASLSVATAADAPPASEREAALGALLIGPGWSCIPKLSPTLGGIAIRVTRFTCFEQRP